MLGGEGVENKDFFSFCCFAEYCLKSHKKVVKRKLNFPLGAFISETTDQCICVSFQSRPNPNQIQTKSKPNPNRSALRSTVVLNNSKELRVVFQQYNAKLNYGRSVLNNLSSLAGWIEVNS